MKVKYPLEAFVLAMVVFSRTVEEALLAGLIIVLMTSLGMAIKKLFYKFLPEWSAKISLAIFIISLNYSLFHMAMNGLVQKDMVGAKIILPIFIGLLIFRHVLKSETCNQKKYILENITAFSTLFVVSVIREFLSYGSFFGKVFADFTFITVNFQYITFGLMFAGIGLAVINRITKHECQGMRSIYVVLPILLVYQPFVLTSMPIWLSTIIATLAATICLYSVILFLKFSTLDNKWKCLPIELLSLSFIYMILFAF